MTDCVKRKQVDKEKKWEVIFPMAILNARMAQMLPKLYKENDRKCRYLRNIFVGFISAELSIIYSRVLHNSRISSSYFNAAVAAFIGATASDLISEHAKSERKVYTKLPNDEGLYEIVDNVLDSMTNKQQFPDIDGRKMRLIIKELLANAFDACSLAKRTPRVKIAFTSVDYGNKTKITINDNGVGFPNYIIKNWPDTTQIYSDKGPLVDQGIPLFGRLGIGIKVSKRLTEQASGQMRIRNKLLSNGAVVELLLPLQ